MRRWAAILFTLLMSLTAIKPVRAASLDVDALPAKAYLLMDATTGKVIYERNAHSHLEMASTTKIMTAILALERGNLSDIITAGQKPYDTGGSTIYLEIGEQQTLENLLYALMLESANDAAVAIAEGLAGSEERFVEWMNAKAQAIGAKDTHFANSHGLHDPSHYTTAYDLALIARYAMQNPKFREIVATEEKTMPGFKNNPPRQLHSHDQLLGYYEGANGVKNGYTEEAGLTNVASARRGDTELIAVVLGAQNLLWTSCMTLLDYGFDHVRTAVVAHKGDAAGAAPVDGASAPVQAALAADLAVTLPKDAPAPQTRTVWEPVLKAPLDAGAHVGRMEALGADGKPIARVDLVTTAAVAARPAPKIAAPAGLPVRTTAWVLGAVGVCVLAGVVMQRRQQQRWLRERERRRRRRMSSPRAGLRG